MPVAPRRVDFRPRPGPTQVAAQFVTGPLGITWRTRVPDRVHEQVFVP